MKSFFFLLLTVSPAMADKATSLCAGNPAYSQSVMLSVVQTQLQHDHDEALDHDTPEKLADQAVAQGVAECASELRADPRIKVALSAVPKADASIGWDAYNTACAGRQAGKADCITAEFASAKALKRLMASGEAPGARTLVQACELVLQADPAMAEWRQCVDEGLQAHASAERAQQCKLAVSWHVAKTGAEAGAILAGCLRK